MYQGIGFDGDAIPEKSAQKIFRAADQALPAGRLEMVEDEDEEPSRVTTAPSLPTCLACYTQLSSRGTCCLLQLAAGDAL
jgi:hypothetical protein